MAHRFPLKEIAFQAGLSLATVDRAVHRRAHVRQTTMDRVNAAIRELERQYANISAKGRRVTIDVVVQAPPRFSTAIQAAFEAEFPAMRPASFGARFHCAPTMDRAAIGAIIKAIRRRGSHGVLLKLPNTPQTNELAADLMATRIPVVTYVTDISADNRIAYVGMDNWRAGATAAFLLGKMLGSAPARVLLTLSSSLFEGEEQREAGFSQTIGEFFPQVRTLSISEGMGLARTTYDLVTDTLEHYPDIQAVYSIGGANRAILAAFSDAQRHCYVFAAHDLDKANIDLLHQHKLDFVLHHDFRQDARTLCQIFLAYHSLAYHRILAENTVPAQSPLGIATPMNIVGLSHPASAGPQNHMPER
jgi:LacI family transcriptional regulator